MQNKDGIVVNMDPDWLFYIYESVRCNTENFEETIKEYIRGYDGHGISDLIICSFSQVSMFPTKVLTWLGEKYEQKIENGVEVDYTKLQRVKHIVDIYEAMERDPYDVAIEEARALGMNGWLSLRMNDHHYQGAETCYAHGDIYYKAKENGWFVGAESGCAGDQGFSECFDYAVEYIREKMYDYIVETLDRYDMDGLELDFQRSLYCFDFLNNPDCYKIMTEFMQRVRAYMRKTEEKRGHKIKLGVRLCRDIEQNKAFGFDVREWVKQGLIDVVTPAPTYLSTDSGMPIKDWKKMTEGTGVEVYAGIEGLILFPIDQTAETFKGFVTQYADAGADKIYPYNCFRTCVRAIDNPTEEDVKGCEVGYNPKWFSKAREERMHAIWDACKRREKGERGTRRHVVTYQENDAVPNGKAGWVVHTTWFDQDDPAPTLRKGYKPLPVRIDGAWDFEMQTGDCTDTKTTLFVGVEKGHTPPQVEVDGKKAELLGATTDAYFCNPDRMTTKTLWPHWTPPTGLEETDYYAYSCETSLGNDRALRLQGKCIVTYLEMKVEE